MKRRAALEALSGAGENYRAVVHAGTNAEDLKGSKLLPFKQRQRIEVRFSKETL